MDFKKLATAVRMLGAALILVSMGWWYIFYSQVLAGTDDNIIEVLPCLVSSSGGCGFITGLASLVGNTAYEPALFWVGAVVLGIGLILSFSLKKESD